MPSRIRRPTQKYEAAVSYEIPITFDPLPEEESITESGEMLTPQGREIQRRAWEADLPREEVVQLLEQHRYEELLVRLRELRKMRRYDDELLRSVRVLEWHVEHRRSSNG